MNPKDTLKWQTHNLYFEKRCKLQLYKELLKLGGLNLQLYPRYWVKCVSQMDFVKTRTNIRDKAV